jgi:hypothetical protein
VEHGTLTTGSRREESDAMSARESRPVRAKKAATKQTNARIVTINEAAEAYPDEWIFFKITEYDEHQHPVAGTVIAHDRRRSALTEIEITVVKNPPSDALGFMTYVGPRFCSNEEWRAYLAQQQDARERGT